MGATVKMIGDDTLNILAIPFGGPLRGADGRGRDTDGEFFSPRTDLCRDWYNVSLPLLYDHGMDAKLKTAVVGRVDSTTAIKDDDGWWVRAQLDRSSAYHGLIKELVGHEALFASSGAMPHLTQKAKSGEILRWPWVELSLTPTPANAFARVEPGEARKHFQLAGIELPPNWATGDGAGKRGRVLSASNEANIRHALADLQGVVDTLSKATA